MWFSGGMVITLEGEGVLGVLEERLFQEFGVVCRSVKREVWNLYDSKVWTLWHRGMVLVQRGEEWGLQLREGNALGEKICPGFLFNNKKNNFVGLARDFPESELQKKLRKLLGYRMLYKVGEVYTHEMEWDVRDALEKVVVRLWISKPRVSERSLFFVKLVPLKGYDQEAMGVETVLSELAQGLEDSTGPLSGAFFPRVPDSVPYELKPEFTFSADDKTRDVLSTVARATLDVARKNEEGILEDWDTEFLHDFRISLRRIRSILSSIKGVFPEEELDRWKESLATISGNTNQVRDLDVYLLSQPEMAELLPAEFQEGLNHFFDELKKKRKTAFQKLSRYLKSVEYRQKMEFLEEAFSHIQELDETKYSAAPVREQAAGRIAKRLQQLLRLAKTVHADIPDEEIHRIRIIGKKLRYLLEFFGELFPKEEVKVLSRGLSQLQGQLGDFNDTSVQQAYLLKYAAGRSIQDTEMAMSLGGLITMIFNKHQVLKRKIIKKLQQLDTVEDIQNFRKMIKGYYSQKS